METGPEQATLERSTRSRIWQLLMLIAAVLFIVFILASVDLIRTAITSQPDCVAHERVGTTSGTLNAPAAKSAC